MTPYAARIFAHGTEQEVDERLQSLEALKDSEDPYVVFASTVLQSDTREKRIQSDASLTDYLDRYPKSSEAMEDLFSVMFLRGRAPSPLEYARTREHAPDSNFSIIGE